MAAPGRGNPGFSVRRGKSGSSVSSESVRADRDHVASSDFRPI